MPAKKASRSASAKRSRSRSAPKKAASPRKASPAKASPAKASTSPTRAHATVQQSIDEVKRVDAILSGGHVERKHKSEPTPVWKHWAGILAFLVATYVWLYWSYQGYQARRVASK